MRNHYNAHKKITTGWSGMSTPKCPQCGNRMRETSSYRLECPNDCYPGGVEAWEVTRDMIESQGE